MKTGTVPRSPARLIRHLDRCLPSDYDGRSMRLRLNLIFALTLACLPELALARDRPAAAATYDTYCRRCHGADYSGRAPDKPLKVKPFDFSRCDVASAEPVHDWVRAIEEGGPAVGLSNDMPGFRDKLSRAEIRALADHLRGTCVAKGWPNGNLNFPRPIFTEKAFPEDEIVVLPALSHPSTAERVFELVTVIEKRIGRRGNVEVELPFASVPAEPGRTHGFGDLEVAGKYVLHADRAGTRIVSAGLEVAFPTGSSARGLGEGHGHVEPFVAAGWTRGRGYLQSLVAVEFRTDEPRQDREFVYNVSVQRDVGPRRIDWTLGLELTGENDQLALTPQVRKRLVRTGALAGAIGWRIPLTEGEEQGHRLAAYLLWDYREPIGRKAH